MFEYSLKDLLPFTIIFIVSLSCYCYKLHHDKRMVVFKDLFDVLITSAIFIFPLITFFLCILFSKYNIPKVEEYFFITLSGAVPLVISFSNSYNYNSKEMLKTLGSFITKLSTIAIVLVVALTFTFLFNDGGKKKN
jgi:hypothetical protein